MSIESTETSVVHGLGGGLAKNTKNATYLNIYATLQPALIGKKHAYFGKKLRKLVNEVDWKSVVKT